MLEFPDKSSWKLGQYKIEEKSCSPPETWNRFLPKNFNAPAILKVTKRFIVHLSGPFVHNTLNRDYKKFQGRFKNEPTKGPKIHKLPLAIWWNFMRVPSVSLTVRYTFFDHFPYLGKIKAFDTDLQPLQFRLHRQLHSPPLPVSFQSLRKTGDFWKHELLVPILISPQFVVSVMASTPSWPMAFGAGEARAMLFPAHITDEFFDLK